MAVGLLIVAKQSGATTIDGLSELRPYDIENAVELSEINEKGNNLSITGIDDVTMLVGETFFFKENVSVVFNEEVVDTKITIKKLSGADISNIESVKLAFEEKYIYIYSVEYEGETFSQQRVVNAINPLSISLNLSQMHNKLMIEHTVSNPYNFNTSVFLEDWALFEPNELTLLGEFIPGSTKKFEYRKLVVPVYNYQMDPNSEHGKPDNDSLLYKDVYYTEDGNLEFLPKFYFKDTNGINLSTSSLYDSIDMSILVSSIQETKESFIDSKIIMDKKEYSIGDTAKIIYRITNNSSEPYYASVEDWQLFGASEAEDLGEVPAKKSTEFSKKVVITPEMLSEGRKINSAPAIHFYQENEQVFVVKKDMEYHEAQPVYVKYIDENNNNLEEVNRLFGEIGEPYKSEAKEISGWTLQELPDNEIGIFTENEQQVTYIYTKNKQPESPEIKFPKTPKESISDSKDLNQNISRKETNNEKEKSLPSTGEKSSSIILFGGLSMLLAGFGLSFLKLRQKEDKNSK